MGHFLSCWLEMTLAQSLQRQTWPQGCKATCRTSPRQTEHLFSGSLAMAASFCSRNSRSSSSFSPSISLAFWKNSRAARVATSMYISSRNLLNVDGDLGFSLPLIIWQCSQQLLRLFPLKDDKGQRSDLHCKEFRSMFVLSSFPSVEIHDEKVAKSDEKRPEIAARLDWKTTLLSEEWNSENLCCEWASILCEQVNGIWAQCVKLSARNSNFVLVCPSLHLLSHLVCLFCFLSIFRKDSIRPLHIFLPL